MILVLDETAIRTSRPRMTQANGSRSLVRPLGRHGRRMLKDDYSERFTHINDYPLAAGQVQDRESSPVRDRRSTSELYDLTSYTTNLHVVVKTFSLPVSF